MDQPRINLPIIVSECVAPNEIIIHVPHNSVRWTPDGGVEELSAYQRDCIKQALDAQQPTEKREGGK